MMDASACACKSKADQKMRSAKMNVVELGVYRSEIMMPMAMAMVMVFCAADEDSSPFREKARRVLFTGQ